MSSSKGRTESFLFVQVKDREVGGVMRRRIGGGWGATRKKKKINEKWKNTMP
jgi:hypothetical protein